MKELGDLENLFKTGDLISVTYDPYELKNRRNVKKGVFQGFQYDNNELYLRIFEPYKKEGTPINFKDLRSLSSLVFIPN